MMSELAWAEVKDSPDELNLSCVWKNNAVTQEEVVGDGSPTS